MSEQNKQLIRDSFDKINKGHLQDLANNLDPKFFAIFSEKAKRAHAGFPDLKLKVDEVISEGDKVAVSWTLTGTHKGKTSHGRLGEVNPTNKHLQINGITLHRIQNGKIVETKGYADELNALEQLGLADVFAKTVGHK